MKGWPGIYGTVTWTPEEHNGFPDQEVVMCEVNSLRDGAFNIAPGYSLVVPAEDDNHASPCGARPAGRVSKGGNQSCSWPTLREGADALLRVMCL